MAAMTPPPKLSKRVLQIVEACRHGERLCKSLRIKDSGEHEVRFHFEPSGRRAPEKSSAAAIASGLLFPGGDGLFGDDSSQTWVGRP